MIALEDLNPWFKTRFTFVRIIVLWLNTISNIYLKNVNTYIEPLDPLIAEKLFYKIQFS